MTNNISVNLYPVISLLLAMMFVIYVNRVHITCFLIRITESVNGNYEKLADDLELQE
jgi:hypothetical protein